MDYILSKYLLEFDYERIVSIKHFIKVIRTIANFENQKSVNPKKILNCLNYIPEETPSPKQEKKRVQLIPVSNTDGNKPEQTKNTNMEQKSTNNDNEIVKKKRVPFTTLGK